MSESDERTVFRGVAGVPRPIVQVGDPVLAARCTLVTGFDEDLVQFIADMFASMVAAEGVGLAANQIGVPRRLFVFDCPDDDRVWHRGVMVNPTLQPLRHEDRHLDEDDEGCLSVSGQHATLARPDRATVTGVDHIGAPMELSGTGLLARCLQHEMDHLDGILYIDRLPARARKRVLQAHARDLNQ